MARPQSKEELLNAANTGYKKLLDMIKSMTEEELTTSYDFSGDTKKKEAHWRRDKNLRDVIIHLNEWHKLLLNWISSNKQGIQKPFLIEGYNWKTYGEMNNLFWKNCQNVTLKDAMDRLDTSHLKVMSEIEKFTNEELFTKKVFDWVGTSTLGSYFISNTSSHYDWAMKKLKAHRKIVYGKQII